MSFSRRYAKERKKQSIRQSLLENKLSVDPDEAVGEVRSGDKKNKKFVRFFKKNKEKDRALLLDKAPLPQASRLRFVAEPKKSRMISWKQILMGLFFGLLIISIFFGWRYRERLLFPIRHVSLQGSFDHVDQTALRAILVQHGSGSMLLLPVQKLKQQLQQLPWVDQVLVQRYWPATVNIQLQQKQALARFGVGKLLDAHGILFAPPTLQGTEGLPYIEGPENRAAQLWQTYLNLSQILSPCQLKILRLVVSSRLAYSLVLSNGITIYLGSSDIENRLALFAKVYKKTLMNRADQIQYVDMQYTSGMAVGWKTQPEVASVT